MRGYCGVDSNNDLDSDDDSVNSDKMIQLDNGGKKEIKIGLKDLIHHGQNDS